MDKVAKGEEEISLSMGINGNRLSSDNSSQCRIPQKSARNCSEVLFSEQIISEANVCEVSHLTFLQYQAMSKEQKSQISNRVRQWALKARESLPHDNQGLFCLVVSHLLRNAHRYFGMESPSDMQMCILEKNSVSQNTREDIISNFKNASKKLREVCDFKKKNRIPEQQKIVSELKESYQSYHNISFMSGVPLKTVHSWCSIPKIKTNKASELAQKRKDEYIRFLNQDCISFAHLSKKYSGKRFLRDPLKVIRKRYLQQSEFHQFGVISMSSMKAYQPENILLCGDTPLDQCLCDHCENCEQLLRSLIAIGMKQIPSNRYCAVESVMCSDRIKQVGSNYEFPRMECISGSCNNCGTKLLSDEITEANQQLLNLNRTITWRKWVTREGKSAHEKIQMRGTIKQALENLFHMIDNLKAHIFCANWHRNTFEYFRTNIVSGQIVQIFDFAQNFRNFYQEEVQSAYWAGTQTAIHTVINFFRCQNEDCSELVTLILGQITADPLHDSFVARAGHEAAFQYLTDLGIPMNLIVQFSDNCISQYKSRRPFAELSRSSLNIIRVFFGEKHGKSHCDGFFGRLKSWMTHRIKS